MTAESSSLDSWVGRAEEAHDTITVSPFARYNATLDKDAPFPQPGDPLSPGAHWLYFLPSNRQSELGENGNPEVGGFLPPVDLPRRMWAGGKLTFHQPLTIGERAKKVSTIASITPKEGRSGRLLFVTVRHDYFGEDGLALSENHNIVYREAAKADAPKTTPKPLPAPGKAVWKNEVRPDPRLLFRFSALMFNAARIHFDHAYVTQVEGYPGLIVNARMVVILQLELCSRETPERPISTYAYRCRTPLFCDAPFSVEGEPGDDGNTAKLWALNHEGGLSLDAEIEFQ